MKKICATLVAALFTLSGAAYAEESSPSVSAPNAKSSLIRKSKKKKTKKAKKHHHKKAAKAMDEEKKADAGAPATEAK